MPTGYRNYVRAAKHYRSAERKALEVRGLKRDMRDPNIRERLRASMISRLAAAVRAKEVAELMDKMKLGETKPKRVRKAKVIE